MSTTPGKSFRRNRQSGARVMVYQDLSLNWDTEQNRPIRHGDRTLRRPVPIPNEPSNLGAVLHPSERRIPVGEAVERYLRTGT